MVTYIQNMQNIMHNIMMQNMQSKLEIIRAYMQNMHRPVHRVHGLAGPTIMMPGSLWDQQRFRRHWPGDEPYDPTRT